MKKNDYAKIGKLVAGGTLVVVGLGRRSLFGMLLTGFGGLVLHRTLRQKSKNARQVQPQTEKATTPEIRVMHETDLASISEADTVDNVTEPPAPKP